MNIYRQLEALPKFKRAVLSMGSFDGVHLGHQHITKQLVQLAEARDGETVLLTFDPHPRIVLAQKKGEQSSLRLLTTLEEKADILEQAGIANLVVVPFTEAFSSLSPADYLDQFLLHYFQPACIAIGYDHKFGKGRAGDIHFLREAQKSRNFELKEFDKKEVDEIAVSSTKIRKAISESKIMLAQQLLGRPYSFSGKVVKGLQLGRKLGFPTANIAVENPYKLLPPEGIYVTQVILPNGEKKRGMLYRGPRPTLENEPNITVEVNIFDFEGELYGQELKVEMRKYLRADVRFENLGQLSAQLAQDRLDSLAFFAQQ